MGTQQLGRPLNDWVIDAGPDPSAYSIESLRPTRALQRAKARITYRFHPTLIIGHAVAIQSGPHNQLYRRHASRRVAATPPLAGANNSANNNAPGPGFACYLRVCRTFSTACINVLPVPL